ncbi:MAG: M23 family peptidase [Deltaproteobacteria bacterium]|nr:MAG: M23 family peptidase [Deltaproteobacteria bacterium]
MGTKHKSKMPKLRYLIVGLLLVVLGVTFIWNTLKRLEGEPPTFQLEKPIHTIGASYTLKGWASDQKSGIRRLWIAILQQGKERALLDQTFPSKGFLRGGMVQKQPVSIKINVDALGLADGEALLRIAVRDYSYRNWWSGNQTYAEHKILIDTQPPTIDMLSQTHNLNQGGTGLAIYRISEPETINGVQVADRFFPGYTGFFSDSNIYIAFFAIPHDKGPESDLYVRATDRAGNTCRAGFAYHINPKKFKQDTITLSDAFLRRKMPEFKHLSGIVNPSASLVDKFIAINCDLRQSNHKTLRDVCKKSDPRLYWEGPFLRLPRSAHRAGFADHRKYQYNGKTTDVQIHLGVDLASTAHAPIPAANNGRVAFADDLGIYGKTILLDHGFGLFSMYGHLSHIQVAKNQMVSKGDVIGFTGTTGLAGGDHLHYAMLVSHTFVNPIEWWDPNWIQHNISGKLEEAIPGDHQ